jgi:hypothetical protein
MQWWKKMVFNAVRIYAEARARAKIVAITKLARDGAPELLCDKLPR